MSARIAIGMGLALAATAASAEVTCEQFGAIAKQTVVLRDQGVSLKRLLADLDNGDMKTKLTAREYSLVRDVVVSSFNGTLSPAEVVESCEQGGAVVPQR